MSLRLRSLSSTLVLASSFLLTVAGLLTATSLDAQTSGRNRLVEAVADDAARVAVADNISPRARAAVDLGLVDPGRPLTEVTLRFNQTAAQSAALDQLLAAQQNPSSRRFHQWLTPNEFGAQFGLSGADLAKVEAWLVGQGLKVTSVGNSRTFVRVAGSAAQVQSAFGTSIHQLDAGGELHFANLTAPVLPAAIARVVGGITGLNDFRLKPHNHARAASPQYTSSVSGSHFIAPGDFYTIYDLNPLLTSSVDGTGVKIGVMGQTDLSLADIAAFRSASGLPARAPTVQLVGTDPGNGTSGDITEAHLDVEWAGAVAPGATIVYVNSKDVLGGSLTAAVDNNVAPILTVSYGDCESGFGASNLTVFESLFRQANAQGQTIVSASGDSGATDCDYQVALAVGGLAVDYPSSSAYVTGLGGTMFNEGSGTYFNPTNSNYSGSAISYIPETVWNETGSGSQLSSGGGGRSASFTKPAWQIGTGVPADFGRDVPDISLNAAAGHDGYLYCASGSCTNGYRNAAGTLQVVGGTSVAAPSFAGMLALLEQKLGARIGNANPVLYGLANSSYASAVFHDVTSGNNASPCKAGSTGCPSGGSLGFNAGTGYDQATGWGSVDGYNLVNDWALVQPAGGTGGQDASVIALTASSASISAGTSVSFTVRVSSGTTGVSTTPTGTVQLLVDSVAVGAPVALTGGSAGLILATGNFAVGSHIVTAAYSGDTVFAGSQAQTTLNVAAASSGDFSLTPASASVTARSGAAAPGVTFTLAGSNGFAGNVALTAVATSAVTGSYRFSVNPVVLSSSVTSATSVLTLYAAASGSNAGTLPLSVAGLKAAAAAPGQLAGPWLPLGSGMGSGLALAGLLLLGRPRGRRRRLPFLAAALVGAIGLLTLGGCGSGVSSTAAATTSSSTGAAAGSYSVLVTASGTDASGKALAHTATVTFVVQ